MPRVVVMVCKKAQIKRDKDLSSAVAKEDESKNCLYEIEISLII